MNNSASLSYLLGQAYGSSILKGKTTTPSELAGLVMEAKWHADRLSNIKRSHLTLNQIENLYNPPREAFIVIATRPKTQWPGAIYNMRMTIQNLHNQTKAKYK